MLKFNFRYFIPAIILLLAEFMIAAYMHDAYIRPFGGDVLIVIMVYCFVKSFLRCDVVRTAICVLLFAYVLEWTQSLHLIYLLNLQDSVVARSILGTSFAWADMLMYTLGIIVVLITERIARNI